MPADRPTDEIPDTGRPLSREEQELARRLEHEADSQRRAHLAHSILRAATADQPFHALLEDSTRGEVAADLYATWDELNRAEPFTESRYAVTGIYADLAAAMKAHGTPGFDAACLELGRRLAVSAADYILACHESQAEAIEAQRAEERRRPDPDEAFERYRDNLPAWPES